jgi:hypothetical protein
MPPDTTINKATDSFSQSIRNSGFTLSTSIMFEFEGIDDGEVAGFECRLDNALTFTACMSPTTYSDLPYGSHTFRVRAMDAAGNVDPTPASFTWNIITPSGGIQEIIDNINSIGLDKGVKSSLIAPLKQAIQILEDDNQKNDAASCGKLNSFVKEVAVKEKKGSISAEQAAELRQLANAIAATLGC